MVRLRSGREGMMGMMGVMVVVGGRVVWYVGWR